MGRLWKEARDKRVVEAKRRMAACVFGQSPYQQKIIEIKAVLLTSFDTLVLPSTSKLDKLKAIKALVGLIPKIKELPEPTKENTWHPNAHKLIELRDWFCDHCFLSESRLGFIRMVFNSFIILYAYDPPYRDMMDDVKVELEKKGWTPKGSLDLIRHDWTSWWRPNE